MAGWIKLHRSLLDKGWIKKAEYVQLWMVILLMASHDDREYFWNGKTIILQSGQLITGRKSLSEKTGINENKIERILKCFKSEQQIEQQTTSTSRLISILNWDKYQQSEQPFEQRVNNERTTSEQRVNTNKELNNDNNVKNDNNLYNDTKIKFFNLSIEDEVWKESLMKATKLNYDNVDSWIIAFSDHVNSTSENFQIISQWRKYCTNWIKLELEKQKNTNGKPKSNGAATAEQIAAWAAKPITKLDLGDFSGFRKPKDTGNGTTG